MDRETEAQISHTERQDGNAYIFLKKRGHPAPILTLVPEVGRIMNPPEMSCPNPGIGHLTRQKGPCRCDSVKRC